MGACLTSAPKAPEEKTEEKTTELYDHSSENKPVQRPKGSLKAIKTTRSNLAKYFLKFSKINTAYQHLFKGWSEAIGKSCKEGASAADIFNLEGPIDKVSDALSLADISMSQAEVLKALEKGSTSPRDDNTTLRFKDLILAICWTLKEGGSIKPSGLGTKCQEITNGFTIVREMFAQIDVDGSGEISLQEFKEAFADLSHGDNKTAEKRMAELDFNNDKEISYPEFCVGMSVWVGFVDEFE